MKTFRDEEVGIDVRRFTVGIRGENYLPKHYLIVYDALLHVARCYYADKREKIWIKKLEIINAVTHPRRGQKSNHMGTIYNLQYRPFTLVSGILTRVLHVTNY
ncbi:hypothetical protein DGG96_16780 [Legionella qingyii]|uniref:Uncharacterized protein n=1 Tax=Legionella qingyii TaxID=2184757 RepID=A0A317U2F4_9GAMM|nr:hypothetical protein DGG96_16780 [Legionella qingyii]